MPNYKKHLFGGMVSYIVLIYCLVSFSVKIINPAQFLFSSLIGSLFPDIDTKSKMQKTFYTFLLGLFIFLVMNNKNNLLIFFSFIGLTPLIVNHRGVFHKTWFILFLGLVIFFFGYTYYPKNLNLIMFNTLFFVIGALSHLFLDLGIKKMLRI